MAVTFRVQTRTLEEAIARFSGVADTSLREAFQRGMRGLMRRFMGIIPPANADSARGSGGMLTTEDKRRGEAAISTDLREIFSTLHIRDAKLEAFLTRTAGGDASPIERALGIVAANEPPAVIHARVFKANKKPGKKLRNDRTEKYLVSETEFNRLESTLKKRVGKQASGAQAGIDALGIKSPGWVGRHGSSRGRASYRTGFFSYSFQAEATRVHNDLAPELERRLPYARRYAAAALERESKAILAKQAAATFGRR